MYKISITSKVEENERHLNFCEKNIESFRVQNYNPNEFWDKTLPKEIERIPLKSIEELKKIGETTYTITETKTIKITSSCFEGINTIIKNQ